MKNVSVFRVRLVKPDDPLPVLLDVIPVRNDIQVESGNKVVAEIMIGLSLQPVSIPVQAAVAVGFILITGFLILAVIKMGIGKCSP